MAVIPDLAKLSPDLVVKNYKELCELTNMPVCYGNSKVAQKKLFERYFKYTPQGHKYIIEEIYQIPLPTYRKISKMTLLQCYSLMLDLCLDIPSDSSADEVITVYRTQKQLHLLLGICNEEYYNNKQFIAQVAPAKKHQCSDSILANLPIQHITDFYKEVDERGRSHINRLIDNFVSQMHKEYLITAQKSYLIDTGRGHYLCSDNQDVYIRGAIRRTLDLEKYQIAGIETVTEKDILIRGRMAEFHADVLKDEMIIAEGITSIYSTWKFRFTNDLVNRLDRYAEIHSIVKSDVITTLNQKAVKYHDMRTNKGEIKRISEGRDCLLSEDFLEWVSTHYNYSRDILKNLIQLQIKDTNE